MTAHAKYSASGAYRWLACPGSIQAESKSPESRDSEASKEGTTAHFVLETILKSKLPYSLKPQLEKKYGLEMTQHAYDAFKYVMNNKPDGADVIAERKINTSCATTKGQFGTVDVTIAEPFGLLEIVDYKYGAGIVVEPEENPQLLLYAIGAAHEYDYNFSEVKLTIIQPRAPHDKGPVRSWTTSVESLEKWKTVFRQGVIRCEEPDAPLEAGDHCKFCRAAPTCPAITEKAFNNAQIVFDTWGEEPTDLIELPVIDDRTSDLSRKLHACDLLEVWIKRVREHAEFIASQGETIEGWKTVQKRAHRKWKDEKVVTDMAERAFGKIAFSKPKLLTPAQFDKVVIPKARNRPKLIKWFKQNIVQESSGVTLVRMDDHRTEVRSIDASFSALNEDGTEVKQVSKAKTLKKR